MVLDRKQVWFGVDDKLCFEQDVGLTWLDRKQVC